MDKVCVRVGDKKVCLGENYRLVDKIGLPVKQAFLEDEYIEFYTGEERANKKWIRFRREGEVMFLDHLESPVKGKGYGKLGLAVFWACCIHSDAEKYAIRFGGGEASIKFLKSIGFDKIPKKYWDKIDDKYTEGEFSVAIGEVARPRRDGHAEDIYGIPIEYFPVGFFESNIDQHNYSKHTRGGLLGKVLRSL